MTRKEAGAGNEAYSGVGDEAVRKKTGRGWDEWFGYLDAAGAEAMDHRSIVAVVTAEGLDGWWAQQVTVGYEQARGMRQKHEKPNGFEISRSRTIGAPIGEIYSAWTDPARRSEWLGEPIEVTKATENRSVRIRWSDGTRVSVDLYAKGDEKTQVTLQHLKLADGEAAERAKAEWGERLQRLAALFGR